MSLNFFSDAAFPELVSGWCWRASFRYAFLMSASEASLAIPRIA